MKFLVRSFGHFGLCEAPQEHHYKQNMHYAVLSRYLALELACSMNASFRGSSIRYNIRRIPKCLHQIATLNEPLQLESSMLRT